MKIKDSTKPNTLEDFEPLLIDKGKKILQFGTISQELSQILKKQGCQVTLIEFNKIFSNKNTREKNSKIINDIDKIDLDTILKSNTYDVLLLGNTLEYLKNPTEFLKKIKKYIAPLGQVIFYTSNITNIINRIKFLNGEFGFTHNGLLDGGPFRFFTLDNIRLMLEYSGYSMQKLFRVKENFTPKNLPGLRNLTIPKELVNAILIDPEATTLQYIIKAEPSSDNQPSTLLWLMEFTPEMTTKKLKNIFMNIRKKRI